MFRWHPPNVQPASPSQLLEVSMGGREQPAPSGRAQTLPSALFFLHSSLCPGLHPPHVSAQSQPLLLLQSPLSPAPRPSLPGPLPDPVGRYRLLLAAAPCWLRLEARAALSSRYQEQLARWQQAAGREGCQARILLPLTLKVVGRFGSGWSRCRGVKGLQPGVVTLTMAETKLQPPACLSPQC